MLFDLKMLICFIASLIGLGVINRIFREIGQVWGIEFMIFFVAMITFMVLMHYLGFLKGIEQGFKDGLKDKEKPFFFVGLAGGN